MKHIRQFFAIFILAVLLATAQIVRAATTPTTLDIDAMLKHEELPWLTLVSCKGYDEATDKYRSRILVRRWSR